MGKSGGKGKKGTPLCANAPKGKGGWGQWKPNYYDVASDRGASDEDMQDITGDENSSIEYGSPEPHYTADEGVDAPSAAPQRRESGAGRSNRWKENDGFWQKEPSEVKQHSPWEWTDEDHGRDEAKVKKIVDRRVQEALAERQAEAASRWTAVQCEVSKDRYEIQPRKKGRRARAQRSTI